MKLIATLLLLASAALAQHAPFGSPDCSGEAADRVYFFLCYSPADKAPLWVAYTLTPAQLDGSATRPSHFREDRELTSQGATDRDYRHSGYDRGHLAPARDFAFSPAAIRSTFLLSNAVPQKPSVNRGRWAAVEAAVRGVAQHADRVHVFSGTLFEGNIERIGDGQVAVPSHTYKVILAEHRQARSMYAVIVPNQDHIHAPQNAFAVSVDEVERRSGLDFFRELRDDEEEDLESRRQFFPSVADASR
jgi:endonuclease G